MNGSCELDRSHEEREIEMNRLKDDMLPSSMANGCGHASWRRLPEQAGRSAWLNGRVLALFRLGEHVYALDGVDPLAGVAVLGRGLVGDCRGRARGRLAPLQAALRPDGRPLPG